MKKRLKQLMESRLPSLRRDLLMTTGGIVALAIVAVLAGLYFVKPAPPKRIVIAVATEGGARHYVKRYKAILERDGVDLVIRETAGSERSVALLEDPATDIDAAIFPSGTHVTGEERGIVSLGGLAYTPLWIFHRGDALEDPGQLRGRRIAIGPEGSSTRQFALQLLTATGAHEAPTLLLPMERDEGAKALSAGEIDALFVLAPAEAPMVKMLAKSPGIRLMSIGRAETYSRLFPHLARTVLPRGIFDLAADIPGQETQLLAPTATLAVYDELHPALVHLLLRAASEVHGSAGLLDKSGEFPAPRESGYPMSPDAVRYYKTGGSLLQRYLPFWAATLVDRLWVMLLPVLAVVLPLLRALPPIYRWRMQSRIYRWYAKLKEIELECELTPPATRDEVRAMLLRLDELERAVNRTPTPLAFSANLYGVREHIDLLRRRLDARSQTASAAA
jgi:TRAP-type uncharacterized transport system substrate-binding protein